jgi:hypothetical protein
MQCPGNAKVRKMDKEQMKMLSRRKSLKYSCPGCLWLKIRTDGLAEVFIIKMGKMIITL